MIQSRRNGAVGVRAGHGSYCWVPSATVEEFLWGGETGIPLRIRKEFGAPDRDTRGTGRRIELDLFNLRAVCERAQDENGGREYFAVMRLDTAQPEVILRQVTALPNADGGGYEQTGTASSFGDPSVVDSLMRNGAESAGFSAPTGAAQLLQSLYTLAPGDLLVTQAVSRLEELIA